jgi:hypothetical protein
MPGTQQPMIRLPKHILWSIVALSVAFGIFDIIIGLKIWITGVLDFSLLGLSLSGAVHIAQGIFGKSSGVGFGGALSIVEGLFFIIVPLYLASQKPRGGPA